MATTVKQTLRYYQNDQLNATRKEFLKGNTRQVSVMSTGTGKTSCLTSIPGYFSDILPGKTILLLHLEELAKQALEKFQQNSPHLNIQLEMGENHAAPSTADVIIAGVATLGRQDSKRLEKYDWA